MPGAGGLWDSRDIDLLRNMQHKDVHRSCSQVAQTSPKSKLYLQASRTFKESGKLMAFLLLIMDFPLEAEQIPLEIQEKKIQVLGNPQYFFFIKIE